MCFFSPPNGAAGELARRMVFPAKLIKLGITEKNTCIMPAHIRIGIAEPEVLFRSVLTNELCKTLDRKIAFCASNGLELIDFQQQYAADIVIFNLYMPAVSGLEAVKLLRQTDKKTKYLALTAVYQADVVSSLQGMVNGYCARNSAIVNAAVNELLSGRNYFNELHFRKWENDGFHLLKPAAQQLPVLKPVEIRIIYLSFEGKSNKEIAALLNLSKRTIDTYIRNLLQKLELKAKTELVSFAAQHGICRVSCPGSRAGFCEFNSLFI